MQLPSNPILFGFGRLALRCDFSKTKIQPLTLFLTPILILSIDIQQYYHYQSLYIDTTALNIYSSPRPKILFYQNTNFPIKIDDYTDFKVRLTFSLVSSMSLDMSSLNAPAFGNFNSASASDYGDQSPSHRSLPPQRGRSVSGGSTVMVNPHISQSLPQEGGSQPQALGSTVQTAQTGNNPTGTDESSVEPTIQFNRLMGVIPNNVITEIRNLVSHQGLQRRKLATAASNLNTLCSQAHEL